MPIFTETQLRSLSRRMFMAAGVSEDDAQIVTDMLIDAELMGLSSHGLQRVTQYIADVQQGVIKPGAQVLVARRSPTTALVDGQWNFGQITARRAAQEAIDMAGEHGIGSAVVRGSRHVGRLGTYVEMCAAQGCIGLAIAASGKEGHWVAPFGGTQGRLATNPIAFAAPTDGDPIVMDFSTSVAPEGKVRLLRDSHQKFSEPALLDKHGQPSCNPADLYNEDGSCAGALLPFGGDQGYKGYSLALMGNILAASLGGPAWQGDGADRYSNSMWIMATRIDAMMDPGAFGSDVQAMIEYIKSSAPADAGKPVMMPGQREYETMCDRKANGVPIDDNIWNLVTQTAQSLGVNVTSFVD